MILVPLPCLVFLTSRPFLAGTNVPSTKHSLMIQSAGVLEVLRQREQQLLHHARTHPLLEAPVRGLGKRPSYQRRQVPGQRAPVRRIHSTPSSTLAATPRDDRARLPAPDPLGRMASTNFHRSFVRSIHNCLYTNA